MEDTTLNGFTRFLYVTEAIGPLMCLLTLIWVWVYRGGFAWSNDKYEIGKKFNWHPVLMITGMVFLFGNAILIYRMFRYCHKKSLKIIHAATTISAFILAVIGLVAVFDSHNEASPPIPNMYSLHSWLGLASVILFACQWLCGLITFLFPMLSSPIRVAYYPIHVYFGMIAFLFATVSSLLGLTEKAIFSISNYSQLPSEGVMVNFIGVFVIIYAVLVLYLVSKEKYKRRPLPEDEMLLTANDRNRKCVHENEKEFPWNSGSSGIQQTHCSSHYPYKDNNFSESRRKNRRKNRLSALESRSMSSKLDTKSPECWVSNSFDSA